VKSPFDFDTAFAYIVVVVEGTCFVGGCMCHGKILGILFLICLNYTSILALSERNDKYFRICSIALDERK
jgi:hypothetical protein